jgi:hypothetical protein
MEKSIPCTPHNTHGCHCLWTPGQRAAVGLPAMPFAMDAVASDAAPLSADELRMVRQAISIGHGKPAARRTAPVARDYGKVASPEDINALYQRLKEEKRTEPAYVYED